MCDNCFVNRQPCSFYAAGSKPVGCPEDPSWAAFAKFGWKLRFLDDYLQKGRAGSLPLALSSASLSHSCPARPQGC